MSSDDDTVTALQPNDPLLARARRLHTDIAPQRDLWPEIRTRMHQPQRTPFAWLKLAAAAVVLVVLSSSVTLVLNPDRSPVETAATQAQPTLMQAEFAQTKTDLMFALEAELSSLSPEDRQVLATNLTAIDQAMAQINDAMDGNPNSDLLLELLLSTYTDQLNLMGDMHDLTRSVNERTGI